MMRSEAAKDTAEAIWRQILHICGGLLWLGWIGITIVSQRFSYAADVRPLPVLEVVGGLMVMSLIALAGLSVALRIPRQRSIWPEVLGWALAMRAVTLFSSPIFEIDYYRYLWDGRVVLQGVSPYAYSPEQVNQTQAVPMLHEALGRLVQLQSSSATSQIILQRVHFPDLPTIYPPVSQLVFAWSAWTTPVESNVDTAIVVLKFWMMCFDIGVMFVLKAMLDLLKMSPSWVITYAWNPLVIKEFANSGHLDAIAVFFTTFSIFALVFQRSSERSSSRLHRSSWLFVSALSLGLGIGSKLYPLVLLPVFFAFLARRRLSEAMGFAAVTSCVATLACLPMGWYSADSQPSVVANAEVYDQPPNLMRSIDESSQQRPQLESLTAFLTRWRMNDVLFRAINDNVDPSTAQQKWYLITPLNWRTAFVALIASFTGWPDRQIPFLATRGLTLLIYLGLLIHWCRLVYHSTSPLVMLEAAFLSLAWFWALSPTLNPWYWTWALPLLPFARSRGWHFVSVLLFLYYSRFWLSAVWAEKPVLGTGYHGEEFFHDVVVWFEHLPWMGLLLWESLTNSRHALNSEKDAPFSEHSQIIKQNT